MQSSAKLEQLWRLGVETLKGRPLQERLATTLTHVYLLFNYYNSSGWQIQPHNNKDRDTAILHCAYNIGDIGM